jgi:7-cyano-7-deazaguanine synthase
MTTQCHKPAVLLLSGGLDSAANIPLSKDMGYRVTHALTVHYGQISAALEIRKARAICEQFNIEHHVLQLEQFAGLLGGRGGALVNANQKMPTLKSSELNDPIATQASAKGVWVPNRNGVLINLAAAYAESRGISAVFVGFNREEAATFPDNTAEFAEAVTNSLAYSTANGVSVLSATVAMNKAEIVESLVRSDFPLSMIWSCYQNTEQHCGHCESCLRLKRAIVRALGRSSSVAVLGYAYRSLFGEDPDRVAAHKVMP